MITLLSSLLGMIAGLPQTSAPSDSFVGSTFPPGGNPSHSFVGSSMP